MADHGIADHAILLAKVERANPEIHRLLCNFVNGFKDYVELQNSLFGQGQTRLLKVAEYRRLTVARHQCDDARHKLLEALRFEAEFRVAI